MRLQKIEGENCSERGGDPSSIEICADAGLNYVSCSPLQGAHQPAGGGASGRQEQGKGYGAGVGGGFRRMGCNKKVEKSKCKSQRAKVDAKRAP